MRSPTRTAITASSPFRSNEPRQEMDTGSLGGCIFLHFILIYYHYTGVRSCSVTVNQAEYLEVLLNQGSANVSCQYKTINCTGEAEIFWFRYLASTYETLGKPKITVWKAAGNTHITINNIELKDSGIYVCGIAFPISNKTMSKITGQGTTLTIQEKPDVTVTPTNTALLVLCILLILYCIAVFSYYFIKSKGGIWKYIRNKRSFTIGDDKSFRTRSVFHAIAAEYRKRYDRKTKKQNEVIEDDGIYQNTHDLH
ncbi:immunoglobulin superfamily member 6 [Dendropsophus ebraccatus]|uniref:immunoglobulin superfamily member 6 n=1 Tax=Dendropsophus ebraccatus TaxID=150705 RepID=UPI003831CEA9